jgi:hypothetical protein
MMDNNRPLSLTGSRRTCTWEWQLCTRWMQNNGNRLCAHHNTRFLNGEYLGGDLQSHEWFMYDDDKVSPSKFTNMQKKHAVVLKCHMKTATILFYVSPSLETRIKNAKTIDLMELDKEKEKFVPVGDIDADGEEGDADGYGGDSNSHVKDEDDNKDDDEEEGESSEEDPSSGYESSGSSDSLSGTGSSGSSDSSTGTGSSGSSDSSSGTGSSDSS